MTVATMIALAGMLIGPVVSVAIFRAMDRRRAAESEAAQNIALAKLQTAVDGIPDRMNGKILRALDRHRMICPGAAGGTNPRIKRYDSDILP